MKLSRKTATRGAIGAFCMLSAFYYVWTFPINSNFHEVVEGKIYRSGQPRPEQLESWIDRYHIKTIINLRGPDAPGCPEEIEVARQKDVHVVFIRLSAYKLIPSQTLKELTDLLPIMEQPMLIHCRNGVDRAATVSTLAAWLAGGEDFETAEREIYVFPGPWRRGPFSPHISDTLENYEAYCYRNKLDLDSPQEFEKWRLTVYNDCGGGKKVAMDKD